MRISLEVELSRLLYSSRSRLTGSRAEINAAVAALVENASRANLAAGVTGALFLVDNIFIQALEGTPSSLEAVFEKICCDKRHDDLRIIEFIHFERRMFGQWGMVRIDDFGSGVPSDPTLAAIGLEENLNANEVLRIMRAALFGEEPTIAVPTPNFEAAR